jgi:hypothetical protein
MKFKPGFQSKLPTSDFASRVRPEPFLSLKNFSETPMRPLEIPAATRFRHVYIAGASQHGKSNLLEHMLTQDIENGEGITLLDPKGDLAEIVVARVPERLKHKCIYIDIKNPIPINFMGWESEEERQTLLADVNQTFMRFSAMAAGDQWGSILRWTIYTLLAAKYVSFLDLYYFFPTDGDRHKAILQLVEKNNDNGQYDDIFQYWKNTFPKLGKPRETPILTRMSTFITTPPLKKILGPSDRPFDIFQAMEDRNIVIVNLMGVGRENGNLVGALLTSKIQQAAFRRQPQKKADRIPHYFYADEFQNFQTSDFDRILSEAGGFKLSLTLANQGLYQLDSQIRESVFTNVSAARIAFRLNHQDVTNWQHLLPDTIPPRNPDSPIHPGNIPLLRSWGSHDLADKLEKDLFPQPLSPKMLAKLPPYIAFFKIGSEEGVFAPTPKPLPPPTPEQEKRASEIKQATLDRYPSRHIPFAQSSTIRPGDNTPSNTTTNPHNDGDGTNDDYSQGPPKV